MNAANDEAMHERGAERALDHDPASARATAARRRALWLVGLTSFLLFLPFQHSHFKGSDELATFEMTRSLHLHRDLAVPSIRHSQIGHDGRRYSYFMPGQAVLALPLFALAEPLRRLLPEPVARALAGPPNRHGIYVFGGELENSLVLLLAPLTAAALVALFFAIELALGVRPRTAAILALLLAVSTHTAVMSAYLLCHTTETIILLGSLFAFASYARGASVRVLFAGSALASLTILVRVPASITAPVLAGYLLFAFHARGLFHGRLRQLALAAATVLAPLALALLAYALINHARWGLWFSSPMVDQQSRFGSPLWRGAAGLLLSPGSSVLVYSPLLLLAPAGLVVAFRTRRAEAVAALVLALVFVVFYAQFDGWSGLWSAPGPRYLYPLVPLLLLPLGLYLDSRANQEQTRRAWALVAVLAATGLFVQGVSIFVRWGSVPTLAGYPVLGPDQSNFLFEPGRSPVLVMAQLLLSGGPLDTWLVDLWNGWEHFPGQPALVLGLLGAWAFALVASGSMLAHAVDRAEHATAPASSSMA